MKVALTELEVLYPSGNTAVKSQSTNNVGGSGSKGNLLEEDEGCTNEEEADFDRMTEDRISNTDTSPFDVECNDITTKFFKTNKKSAMIPTKSFV